MLTKTQIEDFEVEKSFSARSARSSRRNYLVLDFVLLLAGEGDRRLVEHVPRLLTSNVLDAARLGCLVGGLDWPSGNRVLDVAARSDFFGNADECCGGCLKVKE